MKKILIALPLVLIMILSMVPVFAADKDVKILVRTWDDVQKQGKPVELKQVVKLDGNTVKDEALLKAKAIEIAKEAINGSDSLKFEVAEINVATQSQANPSVVTLALEPKMSVKRLLEIADMSKDYGLSVKITMANDKWEAIKANPDKFFVKNDSVITDLNTAVDNAATKGKGELVLADDKLFDAAGVDLKVAPKYLMGGAVSESMAEVIIDAYPPCLKGTKCIKGCDEIIVKVLDASIQEYRPELERRFQVVDGRIPEISAAIEYMRQLIEESGFIVAMHWDLTDAIFAPENLKECTAIITVVPAVLKVDVFHELYNCCKKPDGTIEQKNWRPYMSFLEENVYVPFVEFTTQRIINQVKAEEWAKTRIQKLNSGEWVFESAQFIDVLDPGRYLTGKVFDANGNQVEDITRHFKERVIKRPTIIIKYRAAVCVEKAEEKVDNATVENGNATTAPVTANGGANLPATGAKDVSAFFLSAVALLGLGIFFAKKH